MKQEDILQPNNQAEPPEPAAAASVEKRAHARIPVSLEVEIVDTKTGVHITGRATDVGIGGCYVDTLNTLAEGTPVDVILKWQERRLKLRAMVSYSVNDRSIGMGVSFTEMSAEAGATLLNWLTGVGGQPSLSQPMMAPPTPAPQSAAEGRPSGAQPAEEVLEQLLAVLVRKRVLSEREGEELRSRLPR